MLTDSANYHLLKCVQDDRLGVEADGSFSRATTHTRIRLTQATYVRLVLRVRSPEPIGQKRDRPLHLLPRPESVTQAEIAFLAKVAISEDQAQNKH